MMRTFDYSCTLYAPRRRVTNSTLTSAIRARGNLVVHDEGAGRYLIECEFIEDMTTLQLGDFHSRLPFYTS
ncbi:hypothetical protein V473_02490 [Sphingobium cupriresistens LL01]|uniref:Uncharacterized protein n=1 Tax=Sphingobium cupriresistens LL01 TaxID=1420583 RepID=A0A0J7Y431_9SPHN|nr:hypothetical protein V473_02490 [Sphingobium cupriresistens LL01]